MSRALTAALATLALLVSLGLAGCTLSERSPSASEVRSQVQAVLEDYVAALNKSDSTGVVAAYAPDSEVTLAGIERLFRGKEAIGRTAGEGLSNLGQNTYSIDSLSVLPMERLHALALVLYTVEPADEDVPAFHTTATYVLQKFGAKWRIIHSQVTPAQGL
jgi:ketosteroid isomerase-like protein